MTFDDILDRLEGTRKSGGEWMARCPGHDDRDASLSVKEGEEGVLLKCHAGCETSDVVSAMDLQMKDLFYNSRPSNGADEPEGVYLYEDETGAPLYEVVRFSGKRFFQRLPESTGFGIGDTRRVLWHLPELLAAPPHRYVFIVEGEKDVLAIESKGGIATCNPGGAGKWKEEYGDLLAGRHVLVVVDKDEPGRRHAAQVISSLEGKAATVKAVEAATGKDAADHIAAGHELLDMPEVELEPVDGIVLTRFDKVERREVEWLPGFENYFAYGAIATLMGWPDVNKTTLSCLLAAKVNQQGHSAVFLSTEDGSWILQPRLEAAGADLAKCHFATKQESGHEAMIFLPQDVDILEKQIQKVGARLVIIDPVDSHLGAEAGEGNSDPIIRKALVPVARMAARNECCVVFVHHVNKTRSKNPMTRAGGSIGFVGVSRQGLIMARAPGDMTGQQRILAVFKNNWGPKDMSKSYMIMPSGPTIMLSGEQESWFKPEALLRDGGGNQHD